MKNRILLFIGLTGMAMFMASAFYGANRASATVPGTNSLVSINSSGTSAGNSASTNSEISADGRFVVFASASSNVVSGDTNGAYDIFLRNLTTNTTTRVSVSTAGVQANSGSAPYATVSETGRYVVFASTSSNLIDGSTNSSSYQQLYLRDTIANTTSLLTQNSSGQLANATVTPDGVSSDGRFVLMQSYATNLGTTVPSSSNNVYMLDRSTVTFTVLNYAQDGNLYYNLWTGMPRMSCDGSLVVFQGSGLKGTDNNKVNIYLLDRRAGNALTDITDTTVDKATMDPTISCNGNYIGFQSKSITLDSTATNYVTNPYLFHDYVYNRVNNTFALVDKATSGDAGNQDIGCTMANFNCADASMSISNNGIVVFGSKATNLSAAATTVQNQIYVHDLNTGTTELLSRDSSGVVANQEVAKDVIPGVSEDGKKAIYVTSATNLVSTTDTNSTVDVFTSLTGY